MPPAFPAEPSLARAVSQPDMPDLIASLRDRISVQLAPYVQTLDSFALIDFPQHSNVGDSAIWLGEIDYFKSVLNKRPGFVCELNNYNQQDLIKAVPQGPIFLHGGGNFGDVWPPFQRFRENILASFPDRLVIQLPQTIHFDSAEAKARTAAVIARHGNFVLFVRDHRSYAIAQSSFDCKVHLAPDMAFCADAVESIVPVQHPLLLLLRTDKESLSHDPASLALPAGSVMTDWLDEDPDFLAKVKQRTAMTGLRDRGMKVFGKQARRELFFENAAKSRVQRGADLLSSAAFVISDRLHVHILCLLLGIPHIVLDNSYGKISQFMQAWTADAALVGTAPTLPAALDLWRDKQRRLSEKSLAS